MNHKIELLGQIAAWIAVGYAYLLLIVKTIIAWNYRRDPMEKYQDILLRGGYLDTRWGGEFFVATIGSIGLYIYYFR